MFIGGKFNLDAYCHRKVGHVGTRVSGVYRVDTGTTSEVIQENFA